MGKKSKAKQSGNARAKGAASTPSSAATDTGVDHDGAVGISSSNTATATGKKRSIVGLERSRSWPRLISVPAAPSCKGSQSKIMR